MKTLIILIVSIVVLASCSSSYDTYRIEITGNSNINTKITYSFTNIENFTVNTALPWQYEFEPISGLEDLVYAYFKALNNNENYDPITITLYKNEKIETKVISQFEDGSSAEGLIGNLAVLSHPKYVFPHPTH